MINDVLFASLPGTKDRQMPDRPGTDVTEKPDRGDRGEETEEDAPPDLCNTRIDALTTFRKELFIFVGKVSNSVTQTLDP